MDGLDPTVFAISRPALHDYAAVARPDVMVECYRSDAGQMESRGTLHRLSLNRSRHGRYAFRIGDGPTLRADRPRWTLGVQPAGLALFVDGDGADYISIFQHPDTWRRIGQDVGPADFEDAEMLVAADPVTIHVALALAELARHPDATDPLLAEQLGIAFAACTLRLLSHRPAPRPERPDALSPERLRRVLDHIEAALEDGDLSLADLAAIAHLSPFHFSRAFKAATGCAPHQFVLARRVERAKAMLERRELALAEIAYRAGFASQAHFSTAFRRATGTTPARYRAEG
ncbi:AraC family transcriptional regulator [Inquilinus ginsengisoli]|uniref:AraC family transcriptional regulator n=1 Tax=Inquilinus ginsengisoli TaxID=363840 RepID=A0ABU1JNT6_9PROT|nr:AraC family transcriptional regulator [Inquilinus ginsengisoli]MDR6290276.1 AraC family transcriptional regulator [Inquilinus ginsengisoli]